MSMKVFYETHIGRVREINEDALFQSEVKVGKLGNLFIVADGMGGHQAGEIASLLAIEAFIEYLNTHSQDSDYIEQQLSEATKYANQAVYQKALGSLDLFGMGTTLVACTIWDQVLYIANVGDSRLYVFDGQLEQITIDHSYVEELVRAGEITREESLTHPSKNKITRALGACEEVDVDIFQISLHDVTRIMLCSDGLSNLVLDDIICSTLKQPSSIAVQGKQLMNLALEQGGFDNITVIVIDPNN